MYHNCRKAPICDGLIMDLFDWSYMNCPDYFLKIDHIEAGNDTDIFTLSDVAESLRDLIAVAGHEQAFEVMRVAGNVNLLKDLAKEDYSRVMHLANSVLRKTKRDLSYENICHEVRVPSDA